MFGYSTKRNIATVRRLFAELWNGGSIAAADALVAREHVHHIAGHVLNGPDGVKHMVSGLRTVLPDMRTTIDDIFSAGSDKVVVRFTIEGTWQGESLGPQAKGKHVRYTGVDIFRLKSGKIVEHWGEVDTFGMLRQLGIIRQT